MLDVIQTYVATSGHVDHSKPMLESVMGVHFLHANRLMAVLYTIAKAHGYTMF